MKEKKPPFKHQEDCFNRFKDSKYVALLASMGTGKSRMAIDIMEHKYKKGLHDRAVIIAPVAVGPQWKAEQLVEHCVVPWQAYTYRSGTLVKDKIEQEKFFADCKQNTDLQVYIINFEAFVASKANMLIAKFLATSSKPPMFIIDEASRIKNPDAKSVKNIMKLRKNYPDSWRAVLTGTPAAKSPVDMWSIFEFLKEGYMGCSYLAFQHTHEVMFDRAMQIKGRKVTVRTNLDAATCAKIKRWVANNPKTPENTQIIRRKYGLTHEDFDTIVHNEDFVRFKNVDKLQEYIAKDSFAVSKNDCLDLPEKIYMQIDLQMNDEQKKQIKQLAKYSATIYQGESLTISTKALLGIRVLQICGGNLAIHTAEEGVYDTIPIKGPNAKLNYIINDLAEYGDGQCIVWAHFQPEIEMLERELGKKFSVGAMSGETPKKDRIQIIQDFKDGITQVLVSNPEVGGYGLNLQMAGLQYWYSRSYRTEARLQAEDRSHRIGTVKSPIYKDLVYNSQFEKNVLEVIKEGKDMNDKFVTTKLNDLFEVT